MAIPEVELSRAKVRSRDIAIDTLRGVAIILMVAGHVIGSRSIEGMQVADDSPWRFSYHLLEDLRMPLFTALSGYVYALRPLRAPSGYGRFVWGKSRRLLVPLVTVGTLFVLLQALTPGTNSDVQVSDTWRLYVFGIGHFWFLQSIFLIFLLVGILDAFGVLRASRRVAVGVALAAVASVVVHVPEEWDFFSVSGAIRLLPFFLLGYGFSRYWRPSGRLAWALLAATGVLLALRALDLIRVVPLVGYSDDALGVLLGVAGISALIAFRSALAWAPLARLGYFSFAIYLLHVFATAPTRMLLTRMGIDSEPLAFVACLATGLALPVIFEMTLGRITWISWAFLGQKPYRGFSEVVKGRGPR